MTILNPFLGWGFEQDKLSVLDVLAKDERGRRLNVEMQRRRLQSVGEIEAAAGLCQSNHEARRVSIALAGVVRHRMK